MLVPSHVVGAGYGSRIQLYEKHYNFEKTSVDGRVVFPDWNNPGLDLSIMQRDTASIFAELSKPMTDRVLVEPNQFAFLHPLNALPVRLFGWFRVEPIPLSPIVEEKLGVACQWEVVMSAIGSSQPVTPEMAPVKAHFQLAL